MSNGLEPAGRGRVMSKKAEPHIVAPAAIAGAAAVAAPRVAVLIPCFNEEITIGKVVRDFRQALPTALIYVYDNNSTDRTASVARAAGAVVRREAQQGKGHVVRRMFADIDADIYVLVDGDDTYDAAAAPRLVDTLLDEACDIVNAVRTNAAEAAYRRGHKFGNRLLTGLVTYTFERTTEDMLSGYRVFSRRFVKSFPAMSGGFEIETELTIHAFELGMPVVEVKTDYKERPAGSSSKLSTYRDGLRILTTISHPPEGGAAIPVLRHPGSGAGGAGLPSRRTGRLRVPANGSRAPPADRAPCHRSRAALVPQPDMRPHSRYGDARPTRDEAAALPRAVADHAARAGRTEDLARD